MNVQGLTRENVASHLQVTTCILTYVLPVFLNDMQIFSYFLSQADKWLKFELSSFFFPVGDFSIYFDFTTLFCLIGVGYHWELCVAITFYRHYCFSPTKSYHILRCAY